MYYDTFRDKLGPEWSITRIPQGKVEDIKQTFERDLLLYCYRRARGNKCYASDLFKCNRNTFYKLLIKHGITSEDLKYA